MRRSRSPRRRPRGRDGRLQGVQDLLFALHHVVRQGLLADSDSEADNEGPPAAEADNARPPAALAHPDAVIAAAAGGNAAAAGGNEVQVAAGEAAGEAVALG